MLKFSYLQLLMILLKDRRGGWASGKSLAGQRVIGLKFYEKDLWCLWQGIEPRPRAQGVELCWWLEQVTESCIETQPELREPYTGNTVIYQRWERRYTVDHSHLRS